MKWGSVNPLGQARASAFEIAILRFDSCRPSQAVLRPTQVYNLRLTGPEIRAFFGIRLGLQNAGLPTSPAKSRKVSSRFPKKSRFAEIIGGDWFDQDCRPRAGGDFVSFSTNGSQSSDAATDARSSPS